MHSPIFARRENATLARLTLSRALADGRGDSDEFAHRRRVRRVIVSVKDEGRACQLTRDARQTFVTRREDLLLDSGEKRSEAVHKL